MSMCDRKAAIAGIAETVTDYVEAMLTHPNAFRGQQLRGGGPVAEFETLLARRTGFPHCLATSSATSALLVVALAFELCDKKIAAEHGAWEGSLGALEFAGVELVEVDSLLTDSIDGVAAVLATDRPNERHDAHAVRNRCNQMDILYIEDTGWLPGLHGPSDVKSLADVQVISFGPGKPLSLGEGGAILCRREEFYHRCVSLSQHPERVISEGCTPIVRPLINARIHPLAAVIGASFLRLRNGDNY